MVVIADTSPLNYLVLIDRIELLRRLFTEAFVPDAVLGELSDPLSPPAVARWAGTAQAGFGVSRTHLVALIRFWMDSERAKGQRFPSRKRCCRTFFW